MSRCTRSRSSPARTGSPGNDVSMRKLTLDDIVDLRAYERERDAFRERVIALKKRRRVHVGELMTLTFESTETMRFQVQEMARAERMLDDEQIANEIATYNALIPDDQELSATLFIEINDAEALREWLPKLVGIQRSVLLRIGEDDHAVVVRCIPEDEERLTREDITSTVHYLKFRVPPGAVDALRTGPASLVVEHPAYNVEAVLDDNQRAELAGDLAEV